MNRVIAGAPSSFSYFFGFTPKKLAPAAKAKARPAQPRPAATKPASSEPASRPVDFGHLLKASRARGVELPASVTTTPKPRTLGERHRALLRARGETVPEPVDALPEQPSQRKNTTSTLGERVAALHKKIGRT
ncbi:MAG: hypothetical protein ACRYHQ_15475 [Janthinobacterium lividum]